MDHQTQRLLDHVLTAIQCSAIHLVRVVRHLQAESRRPIITAQARHSAGSFSSSSPQDEALLTPRGDQPRILADMFVQLGGKRKRPITHFQGIPIDMVLPPPVFAPENRPVVSRRRLRDLDRAMKGLGIMAVQDRGDLNQSSEEDEEEDESDEDDDLIIIV